MRPVDKGNGTEYTNKIPKYFDFSRCLQPKKKAYEYCVNNSFLVATPQSSYTALSTDCLNFWLQVVKDVNAGIQIANERKVVKDMILEKVTEVYKKAGVLMVQNIGGFCCYCDTPIPGLLEVEHRCPKSQYPTFSLDWENFLMSCGPCNNIKRDNPNRTTVDGGIPLASENDYKIEIESNFVFADTIPNTYDFLEPKLYFYDQNNNPAWQEVPPQYAISLNNQLISYDISNRTIVASLFESNDNPPEYVPVQVIMVGYNDFGDLSIELCGLNHPGNPDSTYDRRLINRTKAWFTALQTLKMFSFINKEDPQAQQVFDLLWPSVLITAASTGFFSVWFTILKNFEDPSRNNLAVRLVFDSNKPTLFPGTNINLLT